MIIHANTLSSVFSHVHYDVRYKLFKSYGMSYYGCQLWDLSCKCIEELYTTWRKCIRKLFFIPQTTHCQLLHQICNDLPVNVQLYKRFIKFILKALESTNECIKICAMSALNGSCTSSSNNINFIAQCLSMNKYELCKLPVDKCVKIMHRHYDISENNAMVSSQIRDLLTFKRDHHPHFTVYDFDMMLTYLCCK